MFWSCIYILSSGTVYEDRVQCWEPAIAKRSVTFKKRGVKNWCKGLHGLPPVPWQGWSLQVTGEEQCGCVLWPHTIPCGQKVDWRWHPSKMLCVSRGRRMLRGRRDRKRGFSQGAGFLLCSTLEYLFPNAVFSVTAEWKCFTNIFLQDRNGLLNFKNCFAA